MQSDGMQSDVGVGRPLQAYKVMVKQSQQVKKCPYLRDKNDETFVTRITIPNKVVTKDCV